MRSRMRSPTRRGFAARADANFQPAAIADPRSHAHQSGADSCSDEERESGQRYPGVRPLVVRSERLASLNRDASFHAREEKFESVAGGRGLGRSGKSVFPTRAQRRPAGVERARAWSRANSATPKAPATAMYQGHGPIRSSSELSGFSRRNM